MEKAIMEDWLSWLRDQPVWQAVLDSLPDLVAIIDTGHCLRYANTALLAKLNVQPTTIIGSTCYACIHGRSDPLPDCPHARMLASGQPETLEIFEPRLDGHYLITSIPLFDGSHKLTGALQVMRDISHQKCFEAALKESQERYQRLVDLSPDAVVVPDITDRNRAEQALRQSEENFRSIFNVNPFPTAITRLSDWRILLANQAAVDYFGVITPPAELLVFSYFAHPEDRSRLADILVREGVISHLPLEFHMPSGDTRWVLANALPIHYQGQDCMALGIADITAQRNVEARLSQTNLQLEDALERSGNMAMLAELRAIEAETLRRAGTVVAATLNQEEAIERILDQLQRVVSYDSACVQLRQGDHSVVMGGRGYPYLAQVIGKTFPINPQTPDWPAYQNRQPVILADAKRSFTHFREAGYENIGSWMSVPLVLRERVIGLMVLDSTQVDHFTEHSADLAAAFADQVAIALENSHLYEQALNAADRRQVLYQTTLEINASLDLDNVYQAVHRATSQLMPCDAFVIAMLNEDGLTYEDVYIIDQGKRIPNQCLPIGEGMMGMLINRGKSMRVDDWDAKADAQTGAITLGEGSGTCSVLGVPLIRHANVTGAMSVQSYQPFAYHSDDQELLEQLAVQAATTIENVRLFAETQRLAITDDLTGLYNHRYLMSEVQKELDRSLRYQHPLSLVVVDADLLKQVNDTHGHLAGNRVIQALGASMQTNLRKQDILGRFAGDEFLLILPETDLAQARSLAERLRQQVASVQVLLSKGIVTVTISLGVATLDPTHLESLDQLIHRADDAMYLAKRAGRNQVAS